MTAPFQEEEGTLREWSPLSRLLQEIPHRSRRGIFFEQVRLTSVDAVSEFIAVGTSSGVVYWYDRKSHNILHLTPEKNSHPITCVKLVSSVDFMLAAGDSSGVVTIFRVPKPPPEWFPLEKRNYSDKVERYTVSGIHKGSITALEWSVNGQKLFSGDNKGMVVFTEIDFCLNLSKALEIINESYSVVQLSYSQQMKALLISTVFRCIICYRQPQQSWKVVQVGQKERNRLLGLGSVFFIQDGGSADPLIYSCRPRLRLWLANLDGVVQQTVLYKEAVKACKYPVKLLKAVKSSSAIEEPEFGRVLPWRDGLFVSHSQNTLLVFDPSRAVVVASLLNVENIESVATTRNEIFVIFGDRDLIRLSYTPDANDGPIGDAASGEKVSSMLSFTTSTVTGTTIDLGYGSLQPSKFPINTPESVLCASEVTYGTDTMNLPPIAPLHEGIVELRIDLSRLQKLNQIGEQDFDDVIYSRGGGKPTKHHRNKSNVSMDKKFVDSGNSSHTDASDLISSLEEDLKGTQVPQDILPDLRSIDCIIEDVKQKELLLESSLIFPEPLTIDLEPPVSEEKAAEIVDIVEENLDAPEEQTKAECIAETVSLQEGMQSTQDLNKEPVFVDVPLEEDFEVEGDFNFVKETSALDSMASQLDVPLHCVEIKKLFEEWEEVSCPDKPISLSATVDSLVICTPNFSVYSAHFSSNSDQTEYWQRLDYKAQQVVLSPSGSVACKVYCGIAHFTRTWEEGRDWTLLCRGGESICVGDNGIWYLSDGELFYYSFTSNIATTVPCDKRVAKVAANTDSVFIVSEGGMIFYLTDSSWKKVQFPYGKAKQVALGPRDLVWAVNREGGIYVTEGFSSKASTWWQVVPGQAYLTDFTSICTTDESLVIGDYLKSSLFINSNSVLGFSWENVGINCSKALQLSAEGVFEDKGSIWALLEYNRILCIPQSSSTYESLKADCNVVCLASAPQVLWILSDEGNIFVRKDINDSNPYGTEWQELNLDQINKKTQLAQISCGFDVVWACDIRGNVLMLVGSPHSVASDPFPPVWVNVDGSPIMNNTFTQVFVGPQSHMVWALDNAGNVYVREAIFPDFLVGVGWVHVDGVRASHLTISDEAVWALGKEGIYKRLGISQRNYIGENWYFIPCNLSHVSASVSEGLWGISNESGQLVSFADRIIPVSSQASLESDWMLL